MIKNLKQANTFKLLEKMRKTRMKTQKKIQPDHHKLQRINLKR